MPIQKIVSSEKNNITLNDFIGEKDRLFFDVTTRTFRLSDGVTPGGIVVNTGGGGGGSYADFNVDLHLNRSTASSGEVLSWSGTDYAWIAPGIQTSDLSLTTNSASGNGNLTYNNATGAFVFTPPDISSKIALTDLSVTVASPNISNLSYDDTTGAFTFTPPDLSGYATTASLSAYATNTSVANKIELTDLSVGAEAPASGDGAISYDNTQGKFTYTPPVIPATLLNLGISDGTSGQLLQTDGNGNFSFVSISTGGLGNIIEDATPQLGGTLDANGNTIDMGTNVLTDTNLGQFITAYGWGDHSLAGYLTSAPPGGSTSQVQFNDAGAFGGDSDFTYNSTTNTLTVPNITATNLNVTGAGSTTITAGSNIELDATNRVLVTDTPFRVASLTTTQRNAITSPANGDIIYNSTTNQIESYENSAWGAIAGASGGTTDLNSLNAGVINTQNDSIGFIDADDSNNSKKESIVDFLTAIAGSGISVSSGQLTASGGGTTVNPQFTESVTIQSDEATNPVESESVIFYGTSTGNSATRLYRNSSNSSISVPAQTTIFFEADIVGRHDSSTDYGAFKIKGIIDRDGSNNTQMIMNQKETMHAGANELLDANIVADNTGELLAVEVYGESSKTIRWSALIKATSVFQDLASGGGDPQQNNWYGDRAWATGGTTGNSSPFAGYNNTVHLSIATQSNSTQTSGIFSYPSSVGFQATGVRGSTCLVVGGSDTGNVSIEDIRSFNCATLGASTSHGSLTNLFTGGEDGYMNNGSLSDGDRCVFQAGFDYQNATTHLDTIGYVSIQNTGNASDFGNLSQARRGTTSSNDSTRGLFVGGEPSATTGSNRIDYVTIQTTGNATDFGDYTYSIRAPASASNNTITLVSGGRYQGSSSTMYITHCAYVTIQTPGNASTFGNLQNARRAHMMSSDGTYAVTWGGRKSGTPSYSLQSEYQVFATQGNATQFADVANYALYEGGHASGSPS